METIPYEDFKKVDLRIGKVISVERIEGSDKLYKLMVAFGEETKQVLSGLVPYYQPEELQDKTFVFCVNLEPRKMMGLESHGMILCADVEDKPVPLSTLTDVPSGVGIR